MYATGRIIEENQKKEKTERRKEREEYIRSIEYYREK